MEDKDRKEAFFKKLKERSGTVSEMNETMANEDLEFIEGINNLVDTVARRDRPGGLPVGTRHLIWLVVECALKMEPRFIRSHMEAALKHGYTPRQILEALEVAVPPTGYPSFQHGYHIWRELVKE